MRVLNIRMVLSAFVITGGLCFVYAADEVPQQVLDCQKAAAELVKAGNLADAAAQYQQIIVAFPASAYALDAQKSIAVMYVKAGDQQKADAETAKLYVYDQQTDAMIKAVRDVGWQWRAKKNHAKALAIYDELLTKYPTAQQAVWVQKAIVRVYFDLKNIPAAEAELEKLQKEFVQNPDYFQVVSSLAKDYCKMNDNNKALQIYQNLLERFPADARAVRVKRSVVKTYLKMGAFAQAGSAADEMIAKYADNPDFVERVSALGGAFRKCKQYDRAIQLQEYTLSLNPSLPIQSGCLGEIARVYVRLGDNVKVQNYVDLMLSQFRGDPNDFGGHLLAIGEEYYYAGRESGNKELFHKSIEALNIALAQMCESNDKFAISYYVIGLSYRELGDYAKAADAFQRAYQANPDFRYADYCLFENVRCYGKLARSGEVSRCDAFYSSYLFLEELLEQFPESKYCSYGRNWLSHCAEE